MKRRGWIGVGLLAALASVALLPVIAVKVLSLFVVMPLVWRGVMGLARLMRGGGLGFGTGSGHSAISSASGVKASVGTSKSASRKNEQTAAKEKTATKQKEVREPMINLLVRKLTEAGLEVSTDWEAALEILRSQPEKYNILRQGHEKVYGFVYQDVIYLNPEAKTQATPIHEYTHVWAEVLRQRNPDQWAHIVEMLKDKQELWAKIERAYPHLETDDEIADEVLATFSGHYGAEFIHNHYEKGLSPQGVLDSVKDALVAFWQNVAAFFNVHYTSVENVASMVLKDFLTGVNPLDYADAEQVKYSDRFPLHEVASDAKEKTEKMNQKEKELPAGQPRTVQIDGQLLTGETAQKVLGEILESERTNRTLSFPAHTGARGYFYEKPKFVAFDNSSNDCWVEEFRTKMGAEKWCRGVLDTDQVHELEAGIMRDRRRSLEFRKECRDIAIKLNGRASGGDSDGVAYFFDKPFVATFTEDEMAEGWDRMRFVEGEIVIGAYFSDNRTVPADFVILQRGNRIDAEQMPHFGLSMYRQLASEMKALAEQPERARDHSIRVMDNDSSRDFTLAEVVPADRSANPTALEDTPHYETFLHVLESGRRRLLAQQGARCQELDCPKGYVSNILLNKWSFSLLHKEGVNAQQFYPPYVKFDDSGEFGIEMEFHDGFAYDLNPHGLGFYDRVALYYPTMEEVLADPHMQKAIQKYTGRTEITPCDVALKYGQASRMRCPEYRYEAAKKAVIERTTDPSAREFTPEQRKAIELAADCGGFYGRPKGRDFFYDALFCNSEPQMGDIPKAWKADVTAELRELAKGQVREECRGLRR